MSKRKGLGQSVNKSLEIMDSLMGVLSDFSKMPLKSGLHAVKVEDDKLIDEINDTAKKAHELKLMVEDLRSKVKGLKTNKNSRFASRVVQRFIEE